LISWAPQYAWISKDGTVLKEEGFLESARAGEQGGGPGQASCFRLALTPAGRDRFDPRNKTLDEVHD